MLMGGPWVHSGFFDSLSLSFLPSFVLSLSPSSFLSLFLSLLVLSLPILSFFLLVVAGVGAQFSWKESFLCAKENGKREAGAHTGI